MENMKENLKIIFTYIKKQKIRDSKISPFKKGKEYIQDTEEICRILVEQYNSLVEQYNI